MGFLPQLDAFDFSQTESCISAIDTIVKKILF